VESTLGQRLAGLGDGAVQLAINYKPATVVEGCVRPGSR